MNWLRRFSVALTVAGWLLAVVGLLGLLLGWGSTSGTKASASATTTTTTTTTTTPAETPQSFFDALATAQRNRDIQFQLARLHQAAKDRYGSSQCEQLYTNSSGPLTVMTFVGATGPEQYDYTSDGLTTSIPNTYVVKVQGPSGPAELHFALVDGTFFYFSDCGEPQTG